MLRQFDDIPQASEAEEEILLDRLEFSKLYKPGFVPTKTPEEIRKVAAIKKSVAYFKLHREKPRTAKAESRIKAHLDAAESFVKAWEGQAQVSVQKALEEESKARQGAINEAEQKAKEENELRMVATLAKGSELFVKYKKDETILAVDVKEVNAIIKSIEYFELPENKSKNIQKIKNELVDAKQFVASWKQAFDKASFQAFAQRGFLGSIGWRNENLAEINAKAIKQIAEQYNNLANEVLKLATKLSKESKEKISKKDSDKLLSKYSKMVEKGKIKTFCLTNPNETGKLAKNYDAAIHLCIELCKAGKVSELPSIETFYIKPPAPSQPGPSRG